MSTPSKIDLAGYNLKEWSLIILWIGLSFTFATFAIAVFYAITNNPDIVISGQIDIGQFTGVIIGIAMVAVVLVSQQLTTKNIITAIKENDETWARES